MEEKIDDSCCSLYKISQIADQQIIYLDFNGESAVYRNNDLGITIDIEVEDSGLSNEQKNYILSKLAEIYADSGVVFTAESPADTNEYSTIYVGKSGSFAEYGSFSGISETVDHNNVRKNDNAFVLLDSTDRVAEIIYAISHETGHLLGCIDHGGEGLNAYQCNIYYSKTLSGTISESVNVGSCRRIPYMPCYCHEDVYLFGYADNVTVNSGGSLKIHGVTVQNITVNPGGHFTACCDCVATGIKENGGYVSDSGGDITFAANTFSGIVFENSYATVHTPTTANNITLNESGVLYVFGGTVNNTTINDGGSISCYNGYVNNITVNPGGVIEGYLGSAVIKENGGYVDIVLHDGITFLPNSISNMTLNDNKMVSVHNGTTANNITVNDGVLWVKDGIVDGVILNGGYCHVGFNSHVLGVADRGGTVCNATVNSGGSLAIINDYGLVKGIHLKSGASFSFSGGTVSGKVQIEDGAFVDIDTDETTLDFRVSEHSCSAGYLLNDFSYFDGANISITVAENQKSGIYKLAQNADLAPQTISVYCEETMIAPKQYTWDPDPDSYWDPQWPGYMEFTCADVKYRLYNENGDLYLEVNNKDNLKDVNREKRETVIELPVDAFEGTGLTYTISKNPSWLKIDPSTGKFSGTVGRISDTATGYGKTTFTVIASDADGGKYSRDLELLVIPDLIYNDRKIFNHSLTDLIAEALDKFDPDESSEIFNLSLYSNIGYSFCGVDMLFSDIAVAASETEDSYEFKLKSRLELSLFDFGNAKSQVIIDVGSDTESEKYIKVSTPKDFGSLQFDLVGEMKFTNIVFANGFKLKQGTISVNTEEKTWGGSAELEFAFLKDATISGTFEVSDGKVDSIEVGVSDLNIALGTSGFFLNSISGGLNNISTPKQISLDGKMEFSFGPEIFNNALLSLKVEGSMSKTTLSGSAELTVLNDFIGGGDIDFSLDMTENIAQLSGYFDILGITTVDTVMTVTDKGINLAGTSMVDYSGFGLNYTVSSNVLLQYSLQYNAENHLLIWGEINLFGMQRSIGVKVGFDRSYSLLFGEELIAEIPSAAADSRRNTIQRRRWQIDKTGILILAISGENVSDYTVRANNKDISYQIIQSDDSGNVTLALRVNAGDTIDFSCTTDYEVDICAYQDNSLTSGITTSYSSEQRTVDLQLTTGVLPDNAVVTFYYDNDRYGHDGILLGSSSDGKFHWDIPNITEGDLYFYAVVSGEDTIPAYSSYSEDPVSVEIKQTGTYVSNSGCYYFGKDTLWTSYLYMDSNDFLEVDGGTLQDAYISNGDVILTSGTAIRTSFSVCGTISVDRNFKLIDCEFECEASCNNTYFFNDLSAFNDCTIRIESQGMKDIKFAQNLGSFNGTIDVDISDDKWYKFTLTRDNYVWMDFNQYIRLTEDVFGGYSISTCMFEVSENAIVWENDSADTLPRSGSEYFVASDKTTVFCAVSDGIWGNRYSAKYSGSADIEAHVELEGKNRICDIFVGKKDYNTLLLTDDENGDALFLDDIFSDSCDDIGKTFGRLHLIDQIYAGSGDDIIDLTSSKFDYYLEMKTIIYGGDGNDTIWANNCSNIIFGDAGDDSIAGGSQNDRIIGGAGNDVMHGGGGYDNFYFGGDWGNDIVEQVAGGYVCLHFEDNNGTWDENTLTYTSGSNSVTVIGTTDINLEFETDIAEFDPVFAESASGKISDIKDKTMLA